MYEQYYGLRERPFDLSPNPRFLFLSRGHKEALTHLRYGLSGRPGLTVLVGEAGTGKTTLVRAALQSIGDGQSKVVHLSNPTLTRSEFYEYLATGFGFGAEAAASKTTFIRALAQSLTSAAAGQRRPRPGRRRSAEHSTRAARRDSSPHQHRRRVWQYGRHGDGGAAGAGRAPQRAGTPPAEAARCTPLRVVAAGSERDRGLRRRTRPRGRRTSGRALYPRRDSGDPRAFARHPAHDQRAVRQLARQRVRIGREAGRPPDCRRGVPRLSPDAAGGVGAGPRSAPVVPPTDDEAANAPLFNAVSRLRRFSFF